MAQGELVNFGATSGFVGRIREGTDDPFPAAFLTADAPSTGGFDDKGVWSKAKQTNVIYNSYSGTDIVAEIILPGEKITLGELQTISYSIHRDNVPVRFLGHVNPSGFCRGPRTIAGSLIFTVFNYYAFYRFQQFQRAINNGIYPVADMLPPFDVVVTFCNELGAMSKMKLLGVTIIDEGQTMSVDDLITEQTYSYMARGIQPMTGFTLDNAPDTVTTTASGVQVIEPMNLNA